MRTTSCRSGRKLYRAESCDERRLSQPGTSPLPTSQECHRPDGVDSVTIDRQGIANRACGKVAVTCRDCREPPAPGRKPPSTGRPTPAEPNAFEPKMALQMALRGTSHPQAFVHAVARGKRRGVPGSTAAASSGALSIQGDAAQSRCVQDRSPYRSTTSRSTRSRGSPCGGSTAPNAWRTSPSSRSRPRRRLTRKASCDRFPR